MQTLAETIQGAREGKYAIGHFNVATIEMVHAVVAAARKVNVPVIIGASEGERDFLGVRQVTGLIRSIREEIGHPIYCNADHTYSFERVKEAIEVGFDSVIFDGAKLSMEDNLRVTKQCVEFARNSGKSVLMEGELGYIGQSSQVYDVLPAGAAVNAQEFTTVEDASRFVQETGVELFAPAVGSLHGMLRSRPDPNLDVKRIGEIAGAVNAPLVLHGGSGLTDETIRAGIAAGISVVHVSTELRVAWKSALKRTLVEEENESAPYKLLRSAQQAVQKVVEAKLQLFNIRHNA